MDSEKSRPNSYPEQPGTKTYDFYQRTTLPAILKAKNKQPPEKKKKWSSEDTSALCSCYKTPEMLLCPQEG